MFQVVTQVVKEQTVNPEDIDILNENAKELRTAQVHLRHEMQRYLAQYKDMLGKVSICHRVLIIYSSTHLYQ